MHRDLKDDGNAPPVSIYNRELARLRPLNQSSWATGPWLFNECYLYRLLRSFFASTSHWTFFDPFRAQKIATFASSAAVRPRCSNHKPCQADFLIAGLCRAFFNWSSWLRRSTTSMTSRTPRSPRPTSLSSCNAAVRVLQTP